MEYECLFSAFDACSRPDQNVSVCTEQRIAAIINASSQRGDGLCNAIVANTNICGDASKSENTPPLYCHRNCVSTYTSKHHLNRLKRTKTRSLSPPCQVKRQSFTDLRTFEFNNHCIFCGVAANTPDKKNPNRQKRVIMCHAMFNGTDRKDTVSFKESVLDTCTSRGDQWGQEVSLRLRGVASDLFSVNARYHYECKTKFMAPKSVLLAASNASADPNMNDPAYAKLVLAIGADRYCIRNASEIYKLYQSYGGTTLSRRVVLREVTAHFKDDLLVFTTPGIARIFVFRERASEVFGIVPEEEENDIDQAIRTVVKHIHHDTKTMQLPNGEYQSRINTDLADEYASQTMMKLLNRLVPETTTSTLPKLMLCNMVTSLLQRYATPLQVTLGSLIREKELINRLYKFGVVCSYDEVLRFKKSAAIASREITTRGLVHASQEGAGLVQVIVDNFDANISSQNGLQSTHALAMIVTQTCPTIGCKEQPDKIRRITKEEMPLEVDENILISRYSGPKKPDMPPAKARKSVLPLKILAAQIVKLDRAYMRDSSFLTQVAEGGPCSEWNGFNSHLNRAEGLAMRPATTTVYTPLIDMKPSDPDTILTSMVEAEKLVKSLGQDIVVFTCDQQLYKVAVNITWAFPYRFRNFLLRLGGMHFLMNFIGCIGDLMANTGLSDVMASAFGGVSHMLTGKRFPQNFRALRMVVEGLLSNIVQQADGPLDVMSILEERSLKSRTCKLWVEVLVKPVLLMMLYCRAEKEADWPLHLLAVEFMMPYFFAARHPNYARYGLYYLRSVSALPPDILERFLNGEHVTRHTPGTWNGMWTDMMIETTFMRYGKGPNGIIGITLKPNTMKTWALSLHTLSVLEQDMSDMTSAVKVKTDPHLHKEELTARLTSDAKDRSNIQQKLQESVDPLDPTSHQSDQLIHIVSGRIVTDPRVNVHEAVLIGQQMMKEYERTWPQGFHDAIPKQVLTMASTKKHITVGSAKVYDTNLIYSRIIGLQASDRNIDIDGVLKYELAPMPSSMFTDSGEMRQATNKSALKNKLKVETSDAAFQKATSVIIDGSAILWVVHWPSQGTVQHFVDNVIAYVTRQMNESDVYLVFDRYEDYSIKGSTRKARGKAASRHHQLSLSMPLPSQKVVLSVTYNKVQLIDLIVKELRNQKGNLMKTHHKLVVTGSDAVPIEISRGLLIQRVDLINKQEEADVIMIHQMLSIVEEDPPNAIIDIISDDTDVFVLLLHFYHQKQLNCRITMTSTSNHKSIINIKETAQLHANIAEHLIAAHAISGCDTVAQLWGIGKSKVLKLLQTGHCLHSLGDSSFHIDDIIQECSSFIAACYGFAEAHSMTDARVLAWKTKTSRALASAPKIRSLPPTSESFQLHVMRAHLQACIWKQASEPTPPNLDPSEYGWYMDTGNKLLLPLMTPQDTTAAPDEILKLVKCACENCTSSRCSCSSAMLACTVFCRCDGGLDCCNEHTRNAVDVMCDDDDE